MTNTRNNILSPDDRDTFFSLFISDGLVTANRVFFGPGASRGFSECYLNAKRNGKNNQIALKNVFIRKTCNGFLSIRNYLNFLSCIGLFISSIS